jgi:DNA-binding transcriptional MocR family regulator
MIVNNQLFIIFSQPIFDLMLLSINKNSNETIVNQLLRQIEGLIDNGSLNPGYRMPSTRELAELVGVNRTTMIHVYDELWARGYVESTPGSYTYVRKRKTAVIPESHIENTDNLKTDLFHSNVDINLADIDKYIEGMNKTENEIIDMAHLVPDSRLLDKKMIGNCLRDIVSLADADLFDYAHPRGFAPLRLEILKHMKLHNIYADDNNIIITNGSQQSIQLIFQAFSKPGDKIVIEAPGYSMLFPLIKIFRLEVIEIPVTERGMDFKSLRKIAAKHEIRFIYTMPTYQNPSGISMPQAEREELLNYAESKNCIIIEDSIEEELKYFGKAHLPLRSMDISDRVIYLGTFSKVLAPGLRTGWIIANKECVRNLTAIKTVFEISSGSLNQFFLYRFLQSGLYELHLRKMMRAFRKRMNIAISSIRRHIPAERISWSAPSGGFLIWIKLLTKPIENIEDHFIKYGVNISAGRNYFSNQQSNNYIRISISNGNEKEIEEGIARIGQAIKNLN